MMQQAATINKPVNPAPDPAVVGRMLQLIYGRLAGQVAGLAAKLGIADRMAAGTTTTDGLAAELNANSSSLRRFLRALASFGIVAESRPDQWRLTAGGELFRGDAPASVRDLARLFARREHAASWLALEHSVLTGTSAFEHVHGMDGWSYFRENPEAGAAFNAGMSSIASSIHQAIAGAYDFSGIRLLVDVGGGHGRLMARILERFPTLHGIVYDMPHVVEGTGPYLAASGLADRCEAVAGNFFEGVPRGGDAYILTAILHDWDDEACVKILGNCRRALAPGGRMLIGDFVLKPVNEPDIGTMVDLEMLVATHSGRERTEPEFRELLRRSGFRLNRIVPLPSGNSLVEGLAESGRRPSSRFFRPRPARELGNR
jgi:hypothetical protein